MKKGSNLMLFKEGLTPLWEHPGNVGGGKWVIPLSGVVVAWVSDRAVDSAGFSLKKI